MNKKAIKKHSFIGILKQISLIFSCLSLIFCLCGCSVVDQIKEKTASDNEIDTELEDENEEEKKEYTQFVENFEIAVVFDNSGSMYQGGNSQGWCRAKYAMEIFASMLNYNERNGVPGDKLSVFPMWNVVTDGTTPEYAEGIGSTNPIEITNLKDIDKIHNLYTLRAWGTPYSTVENAYNSLKKSSAPQKWMIVLTDGEFDDISSSTLGTNLASLANENIKIQYLGIGQAADLSSYSNEYFYAKKSSSSDELKSDIIDICNRLFQRDQMPQYTLDGNKLTLDVSMDNIIVFVQGKNASIESLTNSSGEKIDIVSDSGQRTYSYLNAANYPDAPADETLAGQVVTFDSCAKGVYDLQYKDAESIQIFYTPNIEIMVSFLDSDGNVIDIKGNNEKLYPGEYMLSYSIVDGITGEDVTNSELIAPVTFEGGFETSSGEKISVAAGEKVVLEPDSGTFIDVNAKYLKNYDISTSNRKPDYTIEITYPAIDAKMSSSQEDNWFCQTDVENWKPFTIDLKIDGKPISDIQLEGTVFSVTFDDEKDLPYRIEKKTGESKALLYIGQDENGNAAEVDNGKYNIKVQAFYDFEDKNNSGNNTNDPGASSNSNNGENGNNNNLPNFDDLPQGKVGSQKFNVMPFSKSTLYIAGAVGVLALAALVAFILTRKAFPKKMCIKYEGSNSKGTLYKFKGKGNKRSLELWPLSQDPSVRCEVKAASKLYQSSGKDAAVEITKISVPRDVSILSIGAQTFQRNGDGTLIDSIGNELKDGTLKKPIKLRNKTTLEYLRKDGSHKSGFIKTPR